MKYLSCNEAGFMSLSCELTCVTYETLKCDGVVSYIWRCSYLVVSLGALAYLFMKDIENKLEIK